MLTPHSDMVQAEGVWPSPRTRRNFKWRSVVRTTQGNKKLKHYLGGTIATYFSHLNFRQRWRFQNYDPSKEEHRQNSALSKVPWSLISSLGNTVAVTNLLLLFAFCFLFEAPTTYIAFFNVKSCISFSLWIGFTISRCNQVLMSDCDHIGLVCYLYRPKSIFTSRHIIL